MGLQEVLQRLQVFDYPAKEYAGTVQIEMEPRNKFNKITRDEIHAVLQYKLNLQDIRQIDPWTIVITF